VERVFRIPPASLLLALLLRAVVGDDLEAGKELLELHGPIEHDAGGYDDEVRTPLPLIAGEVSEKRDRLDRFPALPSVSGIPWRPCEFSLP